ncbi:MAG: hypothetical protein NTV51_17020 [Verrucomicrobia bacterium]|nr:hypothetical protein [Verrucomicrobiota bacterium]
MRIVMLLLFSSLLAATAGGWAGAADEPASPAPAPPPPAFAQPIPELRLTNGTIFRRVTVVRYERNTVLLQSAGGLGSLPYSYIPQPLRAQMLAERDRAIAALVAASAPPAPTSRTVTGAAFLGVGSGLGLRLRFSGIAITAYPLAEAEAALNAKPPGPLPDPLATTTAGDEGQWTLDLPLNTPFLIHAKAGYRPDKSPRMIDLEWRIKSTDLEEGETVTLNESTAVPDDTPPPPTRAQPQPPTDKKKRK